MSIASYVYKFAAQGLQKMMNASTSSDHVIYWQTHRSDWAKGASTGSYLHQIERKHEALACVYAK